MCRYIPSCSEYAITAISTHGVVRGWWMAIRRVLRCRPGGGFGFDPVPDRPIRDGEAEQIK
ncbi:MAG: membrane protein insertion efficiency factor YidD [Actinobacteria bacterium]|nr:membrane protein insertion efficiency factor YidD [Actinomycetota bacterium]MCL5445942.1 membrane protein insertion efficiency factor YidD [Actinomycetota bacterium]